jgi:hypothetical protein
MPLFKGSEAGAANVFFMTMTQVIKGCLLQNRAINAMTQ